MEERVVMGIDMDRAQIGGEPFCWRNSPYLSRQNARRLQREQLKDGPGLRFTQAHSTGLNREERRRRTKIGLAKKRKQTKLEELKARRRMSGDNMLPRGQQRLRNGYTPTMAHRNTGRKV